MAKTYRKKKVKKTATKGVAHINASFNKGRYTLLMIVRINCGCSQITLMFIHYFIWIIQMITDIFSENQVEQFILLIYNRKY